MATYELGKVGMTLRGTYNASASYNALDVVTYNGSSYAALQPGTGMPVTDTDYWQQLCVSGAGSFSANETATGSTWIDGKPIWRRVFVADNPHLLPGNIISFPAVSDLDAPVSISGYITNQWGMFPLAHGGTSSGRLSLYIDSDNKPSIYDDAGDIQINRLVIILEYTRQDE